MMAISAKVMLVITCWILAAVTHVASGDTGNGEHPTNRARSLSAKVTLNGTGCQLRSLRQHEEIHQEIADLIEEAKLIEYQLDFPDYETNPLLVNMSYNYKANIWQRATTRHGRTLLTLAVNYDLLSLTMLGFGVEQMNVSLADDPNHCFGALEADDKIVAVRTLLMNDFLPPDNKDDLWHAGHTLCHQMIQRGLSDFGEFPYQCFEKKAGSDEIHHFTAGLENRWVTLLYRLLELVRVLFLLFGPLLLQYWFYTGDIKSSVPYIVHLDEEYQCHVDARIAKIETAMGAIVRVSRPSTSAEACKKVPLQKLRKRISAIKSSPDAEEAHLKVSLHRLHIVVDHTKLMTQREVPVGLFSFLNREIILCRMLTQEPLRSFSLAGCLLGTWKTPFLWKRIRKCKLPLFLTLLTWKLAIQLLGKSILFLVLIPLPFHIRVLVYHYSEAAEMLDREKALDAVGLKGPYVNSFWFGLPWPTAVAVLYIVYAVCIATLGIIRTCMYRATKFDDVLQDCFTDLRKISRIAIMRMLLAHLLLPLEKFGIILGLLVAIPYYIVMLPLVVIVALFYGIPTFYMIGRFIANYRFGAMLIDCRHEQTDGSEDSALNSGSHTTSGSDIDSDSDASETDDEEPWQHTGPAEMTLSRGAATCSDMFFLNEISPDTREYPRLPTRRIRQRVLRAAAKTPSGVRCCRRFLTLLVGFLCVVLMLDLVLMYAEATRFFLEVTVLSLMGVIANADFALDYFMVFFWTVIYCNTCFKHVYECYAKLAEKIFGFLKGQLEDKVSDVMRVPEQFQIHTGFKYFTHHRMKELESIAHIFQESDSEDDESTAEDRTRVKAGYARYFAKDTLSVSKVGRPYWKINNLVLFISKKDVPRIPRKLFWKICNELKAPGCPGPLRRSIARAFKQLTYMILFLLFVFIIIMSFDEIATLSDSNQLLLTVISGFLPFIIRFVLMPKEPEVDLSSYSLQGKMEEILLDYQQTWPAYDIAGRVDPDELTAPVANIHIEAEQHHLQDGASKPNTASIATQTEGQDIELPSASAPDGSDTNVVDVGQVQIGVPSMVSKPTVSSFAFWDGPVLLREGPVETV